MSRSRCYCFTLNNYTPEEEKAIHAWACKYLVVGREVGEQGVSHLQGYVSWENAKTLSALKKLNTRIHWEARRGTPLEAADYCKKEGNFYEIGEIPMSPADKGIAEKRRWEDAFLAVQQNRLDDLPKDILCNHLKSIEYAVQRVAVSKRNLETSSGELPHEWYYGDAGTGKSKKAREDNPGAYIKDPTTIWWNDYAGEDVVIIDDFDKYQVKQGGDMKRWMDRYPFQAQIKGGQMLIRPKKIVVTSNYHPDEIWDDEKTRAAIGRRVRITRFNSL